MNDYKECPKCGKVYRSNQEIVNEGGKVWAFGLSLRGHCGCGQSLGSVARIWGTKPVEKVRAGEKLQNDPE